MRLPRRPNPSSHLSRTGASLALRFGGLGLQFVTSIAVARLLGVEDYGIYSYAFAVSLMIGSILSLGMLTLTTRQLPREVAHGAWGRVRGYIMALVGTIVATSVVVGVILAGLDASGIWLLSLGWAPIMVAAIGQILILVGSAVLASFQKILVSQVFEMIIRPVLFLGVVMSFILVGQDLSALGAFWASTLSALAILPLMVWAIWRTLAQQMPRPAPKVEMELSTWLGAALPILLSGFVGMLLGNVSILTIGAYEDAEALGAFQVAARGVAMVGIVYAITMTVLAPQLSRSMALGETAEAQRLVSESAMLSAGLGLPMCLILAVAAEFYLGLFGPGFGEGATVMRLLLMSNILTMLLGPADMVLMMMDRQRALLAIAVAGLMVSLVLNLLLVPRLGIEGAALSSLGVTAVMRGSYLVLTLRSAVIDPTPLRLARRFGWRPRT